MSQNSNVIPLSVLSQSMYKKLDQIPELLMVDQVLIENQPALINPTMKSIAAILFGYFIMKGIHEKIKTASTISDILFCCPANKIKVGGIVADNKLKNTSDDEIYKITKKLGVKYCKALISDNEDYLKIIESHKKQDDMADAFLQGFFKIFGPVMPVCYAEKITNINSNDVNSVKTKKSVNAIPRSKKTLTSKKHDLLTESICDVQSNPEVVNDPKDQVDLTIRYNAETMTDNQNSLRIEKSLRLEKSKKQPKKTKITIDEDVIGKTIPMISVGSKKCKISSI